MMNRFLYLILFFCLTIGVQAQTQQTKPAGAVPYGSLLVTPDGFVWAGSAAVGYTNIGTKEYFDNLIKQGYSNAQIDSIALDVYNRARARANHTGTQAISTITGLQSALDSKKPNSYVPNWEEITGKPVVFPPADHSHVIADVTGLQNALDSKLSNSTTITGAGGIDVGGSLSSGSVSLSLNDTYLNNRYLRKDIDDDNGDKTLTIGKLVSPAIEAGSLNLASLNTGASADDVLVVDAQGNVKKKSAVSDVDIGIANSTGSKQFGVGATDNIRFAGTGDASVSFNPSTKTVTINSIPGSGTGGAVASFNSRTGAVVSETGDYSTTQVTEGTNQYFTQARVRSTPLAGLSTATNSAVTASDNVLQGFGKLQAQMNARALSSRTLTVSGTAGRVLVSGGAQNLTANREWAVDLAPSGVTAGTYAKTTVDTYGRVTAGSSLAAGDIPNLATSKITSGTFDIARIPTGTTATSVALGNDSRFHTHANKSVLDSITHAKVNSWDRMMPINTYRFGYDLNNHRDYGFWAGNATNSGRPNGAYDYSPYMNIQSGNDRFVQVWFDSYRGSSGGESIYLRGGTASEWNPWRRMWNDGDFSQSDINSWNANINQTQGDARYALRTITITGAGGLTGGGNLTANRTISLSSTTQSDIAKGVLAESWGNHANRYVGVGSGNSSSLGVYAGDLNSIQQSGVYASFISTTADNTPFVNVGGFLNFGLSSGVTSQLLISRNGSNLAFRGDGNGSNMSPWRIVWHDGNLRSNSENDDRYMALLASGDWNSINRSSTMYGSTGAPISNMYGTSIGGNGGFQIGGRFGRAFFRDRTDKNDWYELYHSGNLRSNSENDTRYLQISNNTWANVTGKPTTFTPSAHTHNASDINAGTLADARIPNLNASKITAGTFNIARIPTGTTSSTVALGNDSRIVNAVQSSRTITAGDGLTGGGNLTANRTLAVDNTVVRTTGNQSIGGNKTFSSPVTVPNATNSNHAVNLGQINAMFPEKSSWGQYTIAGKKQGRDIYLYPTGEWYTGAMYLATSGHNVWANVLAESLSTIGNGVRITGSLWYKGKTNGGRISPRVEFHSSTSNKHYARDETIGTTAVNLTTDISITMIRTSSGGVDITLSMTSGSDQSTNPYRSFHHTTLPTTMSSNILVMVKVATPENTIDASAVQLGNVIVETIQPKYYE